MKKCKNQRVGELIGMYEFGALDESEQRRFLDHLIECEYCYDQVYSMEPYALAFRNHRAEAQLNRTEDKTQRVLSSPRVSRFWAVPVPVLAAVVMAFVIAISGWVLFQKKWSEGANPVAGTSNQTDPNEQRWASINVPKAAYTPLSNGVTLRGPDTVFARAMAAYMQDDFAVAIEQLETLSEMQPKNSAEVSFYLGVSLLLAGRNQDAIQPLRQAMESSAAPQAERIRYYLALAYLKKNQPQQAIAETDAIIESGGEYRNAAQELRQQILDIEK